MSPMGCEPTIPASARPQTYALDRAATASGKNANYENKYISYTKLKKGSPFPLLPPYRQPDSHSLCSVLHARVIWSAYTSDSQGTLQ
jgi:hypothetical protein